MTTAAVNAWTIRELYEKLPFCAFEHICEEMPYLLEMEEWKCEYVTFHYTDENTTLDDIADDYGFEDFDDLEENAPFYFATFSAGVLIVE